MLSKVFYLGLHNLVNLLTKLAEEDYYAVVIAGDRAPKIARLLARNLIVCVAFRWAFSRFEGQAYGGARKKKNQEPYEQ